MPFTPETPADGDAPVNPLARGGSTLVTEAPKADTKPADAAAAEIAAMPEGGKAEFYNAQTGDYNWQAHAQALIAAAENPPAPEAPPAEAAPTIDYDTLEDELVETRNVSRAHRDILNKVGISDEKIDGIIEMLFTAAEAHQAKVVNAFGGQEAYDRANAAFAAAATQQEREMISGLLADPATIPTAVAMINSHLPKPTLRGKEPAPSPSDVRPFASQAEINLAVSNPRYKTDQEYRAQVEQRIRLSTFQVNPRAHTAR